MLHWYFSYFLYYVSYMPSLFARCCVHWVKHVGTSWSGGFLKTFCPSWALRWRGRLQSAPRLDLSILTLWLTNCSWLSCRDWAHCAKGWTWVSMQTLTNNMTVYERSWYNITISILDEALHQVSSLRLSLHTLRTEYINIIDILSCCMYKVKPLIRHKLRLMHISSLWQHYYKLGYSINFFYSIFYRFKLWWLCPSPHHTKLWPVGVACWNM